MRADYVIVGAGSAGCVLANRLSEDPASRVVLIEAGGRDWHPLIHIPAGYLRLINHPRLTWGYKADREAGLAGREIPIPRGKVLGGSSSINGLIYVRSLPEDYDHWAQLGNRGWSWDDVEPYFRKSERWEDGRSSAHGAEGLLATCRTSDRPALCEVAIRAGRELGWDYREDLNDLSRGLGEHVGWVQQTRAGRRRASTASGYLHPARRRPNLTVVTHALAHEVVFDGRRAVGVRYWRAGRAEEVRAEGEVILAAGAIGSPHILQLSGIGDPAHLQRTGIAVRHELRGVGRNFQDHLVLRVQAQVEGIATLNERARGLRLAGEVLRYALNGRGMLTYAASTILAAVKVLPESDLPDVQALFAAASYSKGTTRRLDDKPGMTAGLWQMRPESRGAVEARSPDAHEPPSINPNYLAEERDRRTVIAGLRRIREWFGAPALRPFVVAESLPGADVRSDDELLAYARETGSTAHHASCSCRMGHDAMAVVDDRLRVRGLLGLRVVDASVMPSVTSMNANAATIMIAEKGAAMIRAAVRGDERPG